MSRHEGVSCDSCLTNNFRGRRYKCLVCYDYDLCAACYEAGATNTRHTTDHPMQCILTRSDFELYYGGEALAELPQSYTCPYCSRMGFSYVTLQEHVTSDHQDINFEVICPLCAAMPGGDPNLMTDDFAGHLTLEHQSRSGPRDLISFLDEPVGTRHNVRRMQHGTNHATTHMSRGAAALRPRRSNMHFSSGGLSSLSPSAREAVDPIAELLSQLSGVRRSASNTNSSTPTQLQELQMYLQLERQHVNAARQQLERYPRRQTQSQSLRAPNTTNCGTTSMTLDTPNVLVPPSNTQAAPATQSQFLLTGLLEELSLQTSPDSVRQDRSRFVQELVTASAEQVGEENRCSFMKMLNLPDNGAGDLAMYDEEAGLKPGRQGNGVLRGRARSDAQNAKRRAEANRNASDLKKSDGSDDSNGSDR